MTENNAVSPEHHQKRARFLELLQRIEAHHDGSQLLDPEEFDRLVEERKEAWEDYQAISSKRFG